MATYYIDPIDGVNSNNGTSDTTPVKAWNTANIGGGTFAPGDTIRFKGGTTYALPARIQFGLSSTPTAATPVTFNSYGTGRCILDGGGTINAVIYVPTVDGANAGRYVTIENLEFIDSDGVFVFMWDSGGLSTTPAYNTVRNCVMRRSGGTDRPAIQTWGVGTVIENNLIVDSAWDSIMFQGEANIIRNNTVLRTGRTTTIGGDDCIQAVGNCHNSIIEYNYLDKRGYGVWKQSIVVKGNNTVVRHNVCIGPSNGAGLISLDGHSGMKVYGNYLEGNDGIYAIDATGPHDIFGNVIVGTNPNLSNGESTGVDHFSSPMRNHRIYNNTVIGHRRGIFCESATAYNNVVINCGGVGIDTGSGASSESYNCAHRNGTNFSGTPGTGSVEVDPALTPTYMATSASVRAAGTTVDAVDFYGNAFNKSMGAVQYSAPRSLATRSLATRTTTTRTVATLRGQTA